MNNTALKPTELTNITTIAGLAKVELIKLESICAESLTPLDELAATSVVFRHAVVTMFDAGLDPQRISRQIGNVTEKVIMAVLRRHFHNAKISLLTELLKAHDTGA